MDTVPLLAQVGRLVQGRCGCGKKNVCRIWSGCARWKTTVCFFDLTRRSSLRALGYRYVATHSPDVGGIDVALLYQPGSFRLLESHEIPVPSAEAGFRPTRNVLYVKGEVLSGDTLHVLVCHLPSRLGATRVSRRYRMLAARTVRAVADSLRTATSDARILWMGDFNADVGG